TRHRETRHRKPRRDDQRCEPAWFRLDFHDSIADVSYSPPRRGGVDATSIKYRAATFEGADGWSVRPKRSRSSIEASPCRARASRPPLRGGECPVFTLRQSHQWRYMAFS